MTKDYKIRYWYDRYTRSWIVQVLDQYDYEVESSYLGNKEDRDYEIQYYSRKYNTDDIKHY